MKYKVEYVKRGKWVTVLQSDMEDKDTFALVANTEEYQYRILCDGADVTHLYKKSACFE